MLRMGSVYTITWTSDNLTTGKIRILFTSNGGSTWSTVATNLPLTQTSYSWTVPNVNSTNCKIRVGNYDTTDGTWIVYDDSDSTFGLR